VISAKLGFIAKHCKYRRYILSFSSLFREIAEEEKKGKKLRTVSQRNFLRRCNFLYAGTARPGHRSPLVLFHWKNVK